MEKFDLDLDLNFYEISRDMVSRLREAGKNPEEQGWSDSQPTQKELERFEYLSELLGEDTAERCAQDQDTIDNYQILQFGFLRPDYRRGCGRTIQEMRTNKDDAWWSGVSEAKRKEIEDEWEREIRQEFEEENRKRAGIITPRPHTLEGGATEEASAPGDEATNPDVESSTNSHEDSSPAPKAEPSIVPDGNLSAPPDDDDHLTQINQSDDKAVAIELPEDTALPADENALPLADDEEYRPRKIGRLDGNGVFIPIPKKPADENASPFSDDENPRPRLIGRLDENGVLIPIDEE